MPVGLRAGWVPCVGFQPMKPSLMSVEDTDNPIAEECERAFKRIREANPQAAAQENATEAAPQPEPAAPAGPGMELMEEESIRPPEKPPMKLLMSSKGVQDFQQVQEHYQNLMNQAPQSPEVNKFVTDIASPSGKGAELFAKRKKRMDKFIVDETNVQKSQTSISQQSSSFSSVSSNSSISTSQNVSSKAQKQKQAEKERDQDQERILVATGLSVDTSAAAPGSGAIYTAEVKVVQRASLPPTPIEVPHHSLLDLVTEEDKMDKRKSASFNLAAKGWGTYNKYYTPVTFAT